MPDQIRVHPLGDSAVTISFGEERSPELLRRVQASARVLAATRIPAVEDVVPAYLALTVFYDPLQIAYDEMAKRLLTEIARAGAAETVLHPRRHVVDVTYDGVDLDAVATACALSRSQVVDLHSGRDYSVDILGFVPGWAYLSELDPQLQLPRRPQPRPRVPAGSVAIAAAQTGIYPLDTPGGWHIIGRTSAVLFDARRDPAALLAPGDTVRFRPLK
jgi:KipI family sensor histidine kinase inhibitor